MGGLQQPKFPAILVQVDLNIRPQLELNFLWLSKEVIKKFMPNVTAPFAILLSKSLQLLGKSGYC